MRRMRTERCSIISFGAAAEIHSNGSLAASSLSVSDVNVPVNSCAHQTAFGIR
jgi:hypothetical protein